MEKNQHRSRRAVKRLRNALSVLKAKVNGRIRAAIPCLLRAVFSSSVSQVLLENKN
jgi:hypothetical protein